MLRIFLSITVLVTWMACSRIPLLAQAGTASLSGVLQDSSGASIGRNGSVTLETKGDGLLQATQPDLEGRFHFSALPAGTYTVSVRVPGFDNLKIKQTLLAGEGRSLPPIRLNVGSSGCFSNGFDPQWTRFVRARPTLGGLAGNVNAAQKPIVNARVTLVCWLGRECRENPETIRTDAQGNFEFSSIRAGRYLLTIEQQGFLSSINVPFVIVDGLESSYSISLTPCPNGGCMVTPEPKATVCEQ